MKTKSLFLSFAITALAFTASLKAVTIPADLLFGTSVPGSPADPTLELQRLQALITKYNASDFDSFTFGQFPQDVTLDVTVGEKVWGTVATPTSAYKPGLGFDFSAPIDLTGVDFILGKFGNNSFYFYVADLNKDLQYTLPTNLVQQGLSHWTVFGDSSTVTVPDGGATAALAGFVIVALSFVSRRRTSV